MLFYLGLIMGLMAGFGLIWWLAWRDNSAEEPLFTRLLKMEFKTARLGSRLMLYELQRQVQELSSQLEKVNQEIKYLQQKMAGQDSGNLLAESSARPSAEKKVAAITAAEGGTSGLLKREAGGSLSGAEYREEIRRLFLEGLSIEEIAGRLKIGRGEVELALSLHQKPSWVISTKKPETGLK